MIASYPTFLIRRLATHRYSRIVWFVGRIIGFISLAMIIGIGSAWYMIEKGSPLTTRKIGPWINWSSLGDAGADPYTRARMARSGRLPITSTNALYFIARTDSDGDSLSGDCEYTIEGAPLASDWWSLSVYDYNGSLMANRSRRYAFSSSNLLRNADGSYKIALAKSVRAGNWLPVAQKVPLMLMLRAYGPRVSQDTQSGERIEDSLPDINKVTCG